MRNPFWELLPKLHFSTGIAEWQKTEKIADDFQDCRVLMGCAYL
jgi:hypothetical protein